MLIVFALALLDRVALMILYPLDGLYGQDAYAYYHYARELYDALTHFQAPPPFWWSLGYPFLINVAFLLGGVNIASAQIITLLCGALVAPFAFALAYQAAPRAWSSAAGWTAGLLCAVSGQLAQSSLVIMADAPALMWATLGAWLLLRYSHTRKIFALSLASFAVAMAVWTRWQNLIFAGVWVIALLVVEWNAFPKENARLPNLRKHLFPIALAVGIIALVLTPQLLIRSASNAPLAGQSWLEGWSLANFFARTFDNVDGHFEYALPVALFYGQVFAHPAYLIVLFTPLLLIGCRRLEGFAAQVLLLGWILGMYIFLAGIPYENFRFPLGLFAPVAVVTGIGAGWVREKFRESRFSLAPVGWTVLGLLVMLVWQPRVLAPVLEIKARELNAVRWLETRLLPHALLYTMNIDGAVKTYSQIRVANLWDMDPGVLDVNIPTYLYADTNNIDSQWRGRLPDQLLRGLTATNYLHPLASFQGWTLFRVRDCEYRVLDCE